jgi:hypothetical protein
VTQPRRMGVGKPSDASEGVVGGAGGVCPLLSSRGAGQVTFELGPISESSAGVLGGGRKLRV